MKNQKHTINMMIALLMGVAVQTIHAQTVNMWRGDGANAKWSDSYRWKLNHPPANGEAAHFRADNSVITVNSTVQLDNGMHLYGQELMLKGNGNINLWSMIPDARSVNIPASATGYANMTLCDNLSLNGRIVLSAKAFGTSASKGSLTLKNRSTVTGDLVIGNNGVGSGQIYVKDNASFRITNLQINTRSAEGGMAEIYIQGGTVRIETKGNPFEVFLADPGRRIIIGDEGTLRIESNMPIAQKKEMIKKMIASNQLVAAPGCHLTPPILQSEMMVARAEDARLHPNSGMNKKNLLAKIDNMSDSTKAANKGQSDLGSLVKALQTDDGEPMKELVKNDNTNAEPQKSVKPHVAGYIVFFGAILLVLRRSPPDLED